MNTKKNLKKNTQIINVKSIHSPLRQESKKTTLKSNVQNAEVFLTAIVKSNTT